MYIGASNGTLYVSVMWPDFPVLLPKTHSNFCKKVSYLLHELRRTSRR